jgi:hypothetical protein
MIAPTVVNPAELGTQGFFSHVPLKIRNKDGDVVRFEMNEPQRKFVESFERAQAEGRPFRALILKARQLGFSTLSLGLGYRHVTTKEGQFGLMVAHEQRSTVVLFERLRLMYELARHRPMVRYSSRTELDFSNPDKRRRRFNPGLLSKFMVGTAGQVNIGRSFTLQYVHCSEVAFWKDAGRVLLSLEQALPSKPGTVEILESTANGVGGEFFERWKRAENPATRGDWEPFFFPWWQFDEYTRPIVDGVWAPVPECVDEPDKFEEDERELKALYGLDDDQLNWRRWAIVNLCGNNLERFQQEYPSSPTEAFITSGNPIFNQHRIERRMRTLKADDLRRKGERKKPRVQVGKVIRRSDRLSWLPDPSGPVRVYKWPERGREYVVAADTAEGISAGGDPDYSAAHVLDVHSWEQCLVFQGRIPVVEFATVLWMLGYYYNTAWIAPESNNHGHTVCTKLTEENYPRIYLRQTFDKLGNKVVEKAGWETNAKTRPVLVDQVDDAINSNMVIIHDIPTLEEGLTFVRNPKTGKAEAAEGCHDDLIISLGIALAVMRYGMPVSKKSSKVRLAEKHPEKSMVKRYLARCKAQYAKAHTESRRIA